MSKVAEYKKTVVADLEKKMQDYPVIAVVNMENLPASQLQKIRATLRGRVDIFMTKKRLIKLALKETENKLQGITKLEPKLEGMPAILLTKDSPFKLANTLRKSKIKAPIKPGQTAPADIVVPEGPTGFGPGPIISELNQAGLKTRIEHGKIVIVQATTVAKAGEIVNQKKAAVLAKLGIEPMDIGLDLTAAYENGTVYGKDVLSVSVEEFISNLKTAAANANALTISICYPTKENMAQLIAKAEMGAKALAKIQHEKQGAVLQELAEAQSHGEILKEKIEENTTEEQQETKTSIEPEIKIKEKDVEELAAVEELQEEADEETVEEAGELKEEQEEKPAERIPTAIELAARMGREAEKASFEKVRTKISEDFKEEVQEEKKRREQINQQAVEELTQKLKKGGTLRK